MVTGVEHDNASIGAELHEHGGDEVLLASATAGVIEQVRHVREPGRAVGRGAERAECIRRDLDCLQSLPPDVTDHDPYACRAVDNLHQVATDQRTAAGGDVAAGEAHVAHRLGHG